MLKAMLATLVLLMATTSEVLAHDEPFCHIHLFKDDHPNPHQQKIPGCIEQSGKMYVPAECRVPEPTQECSSLIEAAAIFKVLYDALRREQQERSLEEQIWVPDKDRIIRHYD